MSPLLRKKRAAPRRAQTVVLLDIGTASVGAALVEIVAGTAPVILAQKRIPLRLSAYRKTIDLQEQILRAVTDALETIVSHSRRRVVRRMAIFVPAPWSMLTLHHVRSVQDQAFLADAVLMTRLIQEHIEREAEQETDEESTHDPVFERVVAGMRLNGYVSPSIPERTKVFRVDMMLAAARAPQTFIDAVHAAAERHVADTTITLHSTALATAHALARIVPETPSFLVCDGEGELAELTFVRETIPEAHATIPVGFATLMRTLAAHSGMSHEEARSALALVSDPRSPLGAHAEEALTAAQSACAEAFGSAEPLCAAYAPRVSYVIGDGHEAAWFARAMASSARIKSVMPPDAEVRRVTAEMLGSRISCDTADHEVADAMMGLEALFVADRFGSEQVKQFYLN